MPLTAMEIRNAKPLEKPYKLSDGGGMFLEIMRFKVLANYISLRRKGEMSRAGSLPQNVLG